MPQMPTTAEFKKLSDKAFAEKTRVLRLHIKDPNTKITPYLEKLQEAYIMEDKRRRHERRISMDKKGKKVENYKLTPEHRDFQRRFGKLAQLREVLTKRSLMLNYAQLNVQQMLREVATGMQKLKIPREGIRELPGMNFSVEGEAQAQGPSGEGFDIFDI